MCSLFVLSALSLFAFASAQTCSNSGVGPCISFNGLLNQCGTGFTCTTSNTLCCANANVVTTTATCVDLVNPTTGVSDCTRLAAYCTNSAYYALMTQQCPRTCGRCTTTTITTTCVDLVNPTTGVSDCTRLAAYCTNSAYYTLMTQQCPRTCGRCTVGK